MSEFDLDDLIEIPAVSPWLDAISNTTQLESALTQEMTDDLDSGQVMVATEIIKEIESLSDGDVLFCRWVFDSDTPKSLSEYRFRHALLMERVKRRLKLKTEIEAASGIFCSYVACRKLTYILRKQLKGHEAALQALNALLRETPAIFFKKRKALADRIHIENGKLAQTRRSHSAACLEFSTQSKMASKTAISVERLGHRAKFLGVEVVASPVLDEKAKELIADCEEGLRFEGMFFNIAFNELMEFENKHGHMVLKAGVFADEIAAEIMRDRRVLKSSHSSSGCPTANP